MSDIVEANPDVSAEPPPAPAPPSVPYYLVQVPDFDPAKVELILTKDELVLRLRELLKLPAIKLYVFQGERLFLTKGPFKYLVKEGSDPVPLFDLPTVGEVAMDGEVVEAEEESQYDKLSKVDESLPPPPEESALTPPIEVVESLDEDDEDEKDKS